MESAIESVQKLGVLLIGKTGNGKSSAGNKLLGKNVFKVGTGLSPVTKTEESGEIQIFGKILKVVDTPDITNLPDSKLSKAEAEAIIHKWKSMITSMPYIVLLAIKCNEEYSQTEFAIYQQIKQMWGDNSLCQSLVVLFTFGDRQGENFCGELQTCTSPLRDVLRDAGERYLIFSKKIHETRDLFHQFDNLCLSSPLQSMDQKDAPVVTGLSSSWESRGQNEVTVVTGFVSSSLELMDQNDTAVSTGLSSTLKTMDQINDTVLTGLPTLESMDQNDATVLTDLSTTESGDKNDASISTGLSSTLKSRDQKVANVSTGLSSTLESIDHSDSTVSTGLSSTLESKNQNDAIILCEGTLCDRDQQSLNFACADDKAHPFQEAIECGFTPLSMNEECFQGSERSQDDASRPDPSQSDTQEELFFSLLEKLVTAKARAVICFSTNIYLTLVSDCPQPPQQHKLELDHLKVVISREGPLQLRNPHIDEMKEDFLYHIALGSKTHNLKEMFNDVKFVCFGGSPNRMRSFAEYMVRTLNYKMPAGQSLCNIASGSDRYVLYKVGPVLSVSHGMGIPSLSIIFHEIMKLLFHAECSDVVFFRLGTSGGLGIEPGSVVITEEAVDGLLRPYMEIACLGMILQHPSKLSLELANELLSLAKPNSGYTTIIGKTMCTYDFYEGQARLDGAFCDYTEEDKLAFLKRIHNRGIRNIEMESLIFAAYCFRAGIKSAVVCVTVLDRLKGDQILTPHEILEEWQLRPQQLVADYICKSLGIQTCQ